MMGRQGFGSRRLRILSRHHPDIRVKTVMKKYTSDRIANIRTGYVADKV
jgi:hypothetical protein